MDKEYIQSLELEDINQIIDRYNTERKYDKSKKLDVIDNKLLKSFCKKYVKNVFKNRKKGDNNE